MIPDRHSDRRDDTAQDDRRQEALDDQRGAGPWPDRRISHDEMLRRVRLNLTADGEPAT